MFFFFNDTATTEIYTLSLHDALPISGVLRRPRSHRRTGADRQRGLLPLEAVARTAGRCRDQAQAHPALSAADQRQGRTDRKSTRLNSSHANISYAVFCLKKKKKHKTS